MQLCAEEGQLNTHTQPAITLHACTDENENVSYSPYR